MLLNSKQYKIQTKIPVHIHVPHIEEQIIYLKGKNLKQKIKPWPSMLKGNNKIYGCEFLIQY
jgi:hypothetical protein